MPDTTITEVKSRRIWDSRGRPTVEAEVHLSDGTIGRGIAPAGASRGSHEAIDRRDGGARLGGLNVHNALEAIQDEIGPALRGLDARDQSAVDERLITLDGTPTKARLGGNATVAVSLATLHAAASQAGMPLWSYVAAGEPVTIPLPEIQIFGGGAHAGRRIDIQDLMIIPTGAGNFAEALEMTAEVYLSAGRIMTQRGGLQGVADEGGWWPTFGSNEEALDILVQAIEAAGFIPGEEIAISLDVAASEFGRGGRYRLGLDGRDLDSDALCDLLVHWCDRYPIISIEDPLAEDDPDGLRRFTTAMGSRIQVIGDDFLVTNAGRVEAASAEGYVNAVLIKINQAGTITEAKAALDAGRRARFGTIVSARSGETEDVTIAHLAVGWNAGQLKVGSFARSERMAKWNEVLRIAEASNAAYAGLRDFPHETHGSDLTVDSTGTET